MSDFQFIESTGEFVEVPQSDDGKIRTDEQMKAWADANGCDYRVAGESELFIDIDSDVDFARFQHVWPIFAEHFGDKSQPVITPSKSGGEKRHVVVGLKSPQPLLVRIALQAAMESDGRREAISVLRALAGEPNVVVFFEPRSADALADDLPF